MPVTGEVRLIVQGDDFGMCHAVNVGTMQAFREGILTQASTMAACPWFTEAAALARESGIPLGVHQTLTCEWDNLRWRPLTGGPSLVGADGTFFRTVAEARTSISRGDAVRELSAQVAKFAAEGLAIDYLDVHMGESAPDAYDEIASAAGKPYIYGPVESQRFASMSGDNVYQDTSSAGSSRARSCASGSSTARVRRSASSAVSFNSVIRHRMFAS